MANIITQTCSHCGETKPLNSEHYHRNKGRKCGFLASCKTCQMKKIVKYNREHKDYWKQYRVDNEDYIRDYYKEYYDTDQPIKIYAIQNTEGECYIGMTQQRDWKVRIPQHHSSYRIEHGAYPKLHESLDKHSWDNHSVVLVEELDTKDRSRGMSRETFWIRHYIQMGKSLNVHKVK
jgi:predicted GIY-YIG superfamily endonuclease